VNSPVTVRQLVDRLKAVYCGSVGYEYMHIQSRAQCNWIRERIECMEDKPLSKAEKLQLLDRLAYAEVLPACATLRATSASFRCFCVRADAGNVCSW
jgi:2-oxoglutarate dehydrogenase complex dehydrogenase (E1) component-like enzyme